MATLVTAAVLQNHRFYPLLLVKWNLSKSSKVIIQLKARKWIQ